MDSRRICWSWALSALAAFGRRSRWFAAIAGGNSPVGLSSLQAARAELLLLVFSELYERRSLELTSNLAFSDFRQIFQGERMTAALLDRLTHHCEIFETDGEGFRFGQSMKGNKKARKQI